MSIYTKTGDKGETSLFGGKRISKADPIVDAYGSIDELNSWVGLIASEITHEEKKEFLIKIQADLHILAAMLAGWETDLSPLATRVTEMEVEIDTMEKELPILKNFVLPGGASLAAKTHLVRTITRKVERKIIRLYEFQSARLAEDDKSRQVKKSLKNQNFSVQAEHQEDGDKQKIVIQYLNRLSDLFFDLARFINMRAGIPDVVWIGIPRKDK